MPPINFSSKSHCILCDSPTSSNSHDHSSYPTSSLLCPHPQLPTLGTTSSPSAIQNNIDVLNHLKSRGVILPSFLERTLSFLDKAAHTSVIIIGGVVRSAGIFFLLGGAAHMVLVLFRMSKTLLQLESLHLIIKKLTESGSLPTLLGGIILVKLGDALIGKESINLLLGSALMAFPLYMSSLTPSGSSANKT